MGASPTRRKLGALAVAAFALIAVHAALGGVDPRKQPVERPNAADTRRAKTSLIQLSDLLKGFRAEKKLTRAPFIPRCSGYPGDRSDVTITGAADSSFKFYSNSVGSTALFFKTAADSDRYWQKTVRLKYIQCLAATVILDGIKPRILMAKRIKTGPTTADQTIAYRQIARVSGTGQTPSYWIETAVFVKQSRSIGMLRMIDIGHVCMCHADLARDLARRLSNAEHSFSGSDPKPPRG